MARNRASCRCRTSLVERPSSRKAWAMKAAWRAALRSISSGRRPQRIENARGWRGSHGGRRAGASAAQEHAPQIRVEQVMAGRQQHAERRALVIGVEAVIYHRGVVEIEERRVESRSLRVDQEVEEVT